MSKMMQVKSKLLVAAVTVILVSSLFMSANFVASSNGQPTTYIIPMEDWIKNDDVNAIRLVNLLLQEDVPVSWALDSFTVGGTTFPPGHSM